MPTYEYECEKCAYTFERFQSMTEKPLRVCPKCKARKLRRLIGAGSGIIFKGTGFYETDYKRKEQKTEPKPSADTGAKEAKKEEKKTEPASASPADKTIKK